MDNYTNDAKLYDNFVKIKKIYEDTGKTDDENYIKTCAYLSTHQNPKDIYTKACKELKIDIKDPPPHGTY